MNVNKMPNIWTTWKGTNWLNTKELEVPVDDPNKDENHKKLDEAERRQLNYNEWHLEKLMLSMN